MSIQPIWQDCGNDLRIGLRGNGLKASVRKVLTSVMPEIADGIFAIPTVTCFASVRGRNAIPITATAFACHVLHSEMQTNTVRCRFQRALLHQYWHIGTTDAGHSHQIKRHVPLDVSVPSRILSVAHYISWNRGETLVLRDWPAIRKRKDSLGVHPDPGEALRELIAQKPRDSPALQTPQPVFFHRGWNRHIDFINPPQCFFVKNQSVRSEAFVQMRDGGGSDDG